MKFRADLEYVTGYLRDGHLAGELTDEEYAEWKTLGPQEQHEMLWEYGVIQVSDFRISDTGPIIDVAWEQDENT